MITSHRVAPLTAHRSRRLRAAGAALLVVGMVSACSSTADGAAGTTTIQLADDSRPATPASSAVDPGTTDSSPRPSSTTTGTTGTTDDDASDNSSSVLASPTAATGGPVGVDDFLAAMDAAIAAAGGVGVESIDRDRGGFDVDVQLADGTDRSVFVPAQGDPIVEDDDSEDGTPDPTLSADQVRSLFAAAATYSPTATVEDLSTDDDGAPFELTLREADGTETELDADAAFALTVTDIDRD